MNEHRGETPFRALGREMFVVYRTPELAAMRHALGFGRPDPLAPPRWEEIDDEEKVEVPGEPGKWITRSKKTRKLIGFAERNQRLLEAFEATFLNPGIDDVVVMIREGLREWERRSQSVLSADEFRELTIELRPQGLQTLHIRAVGNSLGSGDSRGESGPGDGDPNAQSAAPAS